MTNNANELKWFDVRVTFDEHSIMDGIKGYNEANAILNAWHNWEDAQEIRLVIK